jgi:hypothetical protein
MGHPIDVMVGPKLQVLRFAQDDSLGGLLVYEANQMEGLAHSPKLVRFGMFEVDLRADNCGSPGGSGCGIGAGQELESAPSRLVVVRPILRCLPET